MANVLMVIAPSDFRDEEYFHTREEIEKAGHRVDVASLEDVAVSMVEKKEVVVDLLLDQCDVADYDAVIFVGGNGASCYFDNEKAHEMAFQTFEQGKVIAAICVAPHILAKAGVLDGKKATSWSSEKKVLEEHGAEVSDKHVVVDSNVVTADGPGAAREFGKKIASMLNEIINGKNEEEEESEHSNKGGGGEVPL